MTKYLADRTTMEVVGATTIVDWLTPRSSSGMSRLKARGPWLPGQEAAWNAEFARLRQTEEWIEANAEGSRAACGSLEELPDLDRTRSRLRAGTTLEDGDLFALKRFLYHSVRVLEAASELVASWGAAPDLSQAAASLRDAIHPEKEPSARFRLSSSLQPGLAEARRAEKSARRTWESAREELEGAIVSELGGRFDLRGSYRPDDIEAKRLSEDERLRLVDGRWLATGEALTAAKQEHDAAKGQVESLEREVRERLTVRVSGQMELLDSLEEWLGELDVRIAVVELKERLDGSWPTTGAEVRIGAGRAPQMAERLGDGIQPIDVALSGGATIVTGPNMGGKSALLKLIGICQWLAQYGLPVPCAEFEAPFVDRIVYIGSEEPGSRDETEGLSSFGREIRRFVESHGHSGRTLWLMDELGRGTHPEDGASLAVEIVERLVSEGDDVVAATHFPALAAMDGARHLRIRGLVDEPGLRASVEASSDAIALRQALQRAMDYRPEEVDQDDVPRDARIVARALGLWSNDGEE